MKDLAGKTAVVTGASQGIGPYIAKSLAAKGMKLVLAARSADKLADVAAEIEAETLVVTTDLLDVEDRRNLSRRAVAEFGSIDVLVNNAGLEEIVEFQAQESDWIETAIATNLTAPILLTRQVLPQMIERGSGHIVNVASVAGLASMPYGATYAGTKAGLATWSVSLAAEMEPHGVGVSTVCPGFVTDAGMFARKDSTPPATLGQCSPDDVARAVLKAIEQNLPEVVVSGRPIRPFLMLRAGAPRLARTVARKMGLVSYLRSLVGREGKETI